MWKWFLFRLMNLNQYLTKTIKKDRISTSNCFVELAGNSSDLFKTYRLNKGFKNFLLDKNGVIVAKDITPSQLSSYLN